MVVVPAGTFTMGDGGGRPDETPHAVSVGSFYLDTNPVTQELYEKVMGVNPSKRRGPEEPGRADAVDRRRPLLQQVLGAGRAEALLRSEHLGVRLRRRRLSSADRGGVGVCLSGRRHREVLLRRRRDGIAADTPGSSRIRRASRSRWARSSPTLGPVRHARQRLAVVQRLVRRERITARVRGRTRAARPRARCACSAEGRGTARPKSAARPIATRSSPSTPTPASGPTATASGGAESRRRGTQPRRSPSAGIDRCSDEPRPRNTVDPAPVPLLGRDRARSTWPASRGPSFSSAIAAAR